MTLQGKSVSTVGLLQLRNFFFFFFAPPYSKWLQRVTTLRTFYSCLRRTVPSFLIQFQVKRKEMRSNLTVDLVSAPMNQNTAALTPKLDGNISDPGKLIF